MKKILLISLFVLLTANYSVAATVSWEGLVWNYSSPESVSTVGGNLVVTTTSSPGWARAYVNTDYFKIVVDMDSGTKSVIMIDAWQPDDSGDQLALNIPLNTIGYDDDDTSIGSWTWTSLTMPTTGTHTYVFQRANDGNVTITLDSTGLWNSSDKPFDLDMSMTSVHAGAMNGTGVFTSASVPIPGAVWLLGSGLIGIVGIRRKLKN